MLPHPQKHHGNPRRMHHTDERTDHIADGIAFGNNKPVHTYTVIAEITLKHEGGQLSDQGGIRRARCCRQGPHGIQVVL